MQKVSCRAPSALSSPGSIVSKIREFAVSALSEASMKLSNVDKVNLGREHGVASWLLEGVARLVEREPEMSADDLEAALGLRTAFKIVSLQARFVNNGPISTVMISGTLYPSVPISALRCCSCLGQLITPTSFACQSCSKSIGTDDRRAVYLSVYTSAWPTTQQGLPAFPVVMNQVHCASCTKPLFVTTVTCASCGLGRAPCWAVYAMRGPAWLGIYTPSSAIRDVFKDELASCDM